MSGKDTYRQETLSDSILTKLSQSELQHCLTHFVLGVQKKDSSFTTSAVDKCVT